MKHIALIILVSFFAFSCTKEKVPTSVQKSYYQSNGNFLVLKIGDELEAAYEYQLTSTSLSNDSLPLHWDSSDAGIDGMTMHYFLTFVPNDDTIIQHVNNYFSYNAQFIDTSILEKLTTLIAYNHSDFQVIASSNNVNDATIWSKIANLDILKTYRTSNPTAKIGIQRIVENVYDPQFGFSVPIEKHLVFLVI